jgi:hypothetical protein
MSAWFGAIGAAAMLALGVGASAEEVPDVVGLPAAGHHVPTPRLPVPSPEHELDLHPLSTLVERNPAAFVGLYRDERGTAVVVFGPGADRGSWRGRLAAAAAGLPYRTETCSRGRRSLRAMQDEIAEWDWSAGRRPPFGVWVDPSSCTVRVESDLLTRRDIATLVNRFGRAISIDTTPGSHPELLARSG